MCDLARDMNPAMRVVETTDFLDDLGDRVIRKIKRRIKR
jgi:predicted thioredoxin/glutaredoxin